MKTDDITQELYHALLRLSSLYSREGENHLTHFERVAKDFYDQTGCLRPGKDDAAGVYSKEEREEVWDAWVGGVKQQARQALKNYEES